jgi:hypothetical protein
MKKLKISLEDLTRNLSSAGFAPETLSLNRRIVERRWCRHTAGKESVRLVYHGFSDDKNYLVFGACPVNEKCGAVYFFRMFSGM